MKFSKIAIFIPLLFLVGCETLAPQTEKLADAGGRAAAWYCENIPTSERPAFKSQLEAACDKHAEKAGCEILLTCPQ